MKTANLRELVDKCIIVFLEKILPSKTIVNQIPKKDFVKGLSYLCTRIN